MDTYTPHLTSLEYFGLETLFRHLITEYGSTYQEKVPTWISDGPIRESPSVIHITSAALPQGNSL